MSVNLREELKNDPLGVGYAAMSDAQALVSLNDPIEISQDVSIADLETYLFQISKFDAISEVGKAAGNAANVAAKAVTQIFNSKKTHVDIGHSVFVDGLAALVTSSDLTQSEADEITAMGKKLTTRAKQIGTRLPVRLGYITTARL